MTRTFHDASQRRQHKALCVRTSYQEGSCRSWAELQNVCGKIGMSSAQAAFSGCCWCDVVKSCNSGIVLGTSLHSAGRMYAQLRESCLGNHRLLEYSVVCAILTAAVSRTASQLRVAACNLTKHTTAACCMHEHTSLSNLCRDRAQTGRVGQSAAHHPHHNWTATRTAAVAGQR